jgi:hypothetical protein
MFACGLVLCPNHLIGNWPAKVDAARRAAALRGKRLGIHGLDGLRGGAPAAVDGTGANQARVSKWNAAGGRLRPMAFCQPALGTAPGVFSK